MNKDGLKEPDYEIILNKQQLITIPKNKESINNSDKNKQLNKMSKVYMYIIELKEN